MSGLAAITGVTSLTNNCLREYMGQRRAPPASTGWRGEPPAQSMRVLRDCESLYPTWNLEA